MEGFGAAIRAIIDATLGIAEPITDFLAYMHLLAMFCVVCGMLFSFHYRPPKTKRGRILLALTVFALLVVCCMSLWYWFIGMLRGDAS